MGKIYDLMWDSLAKKFNDGEEIEGYTEEELLSNPKFVKALLRNDKKALIYVEDELVRNYNLTRELVLEFSDDYDFASKIIEIYINENFKKEDDENSNIIHFNGRDIESQEYENLNCYELYAIITKNINPYDITSKDQKGYYMKLRMEFMLETTRIYDYILDNPDLSSLGLGFQVFEYILRNNPYLLEYFAKSMSIDLINGKYDDHENSYTFEEMIHMEYSTQEEFKSSFEKEGIYAFFIKKASKRDLALTNYLMKNKDKNLFDSYQESYNKINYNWENYEISNFHNIADELVGNINEAIINESLSPISSLDVIKYLQEKYNAENDIIFENPVFSFKGECEEFDIHPSVELILKEKNGNVSTIEDYKISQCLDYAEYLYLEIKNHRILTPDIQILSYEEYQEQKRENKNIRTRKRKKDE